MAEPVWIISSGRSTELEPDIQESEHLPARVHEFQVSDIGYYLLSPRPIKVAGNLIGCEVHYRSGFLSNLRRRLGRWRQPTEKKDHTHGSIVEEWTISNAVDLKNVRDKALASHLGVIVEDLRPFNPILKKVAALDLNDIDDLAGITQDPAGTKTRLILKGDLEEKRDYLLEHLLKDVPITLRNAYLAEGLFEMRGYHLPDYQSVREHRLVKYAVEGQSRAAILGTGNRIDAHISDMNRLRYVRIFERAVRTDEKMADCIRQCVRGELIPLKLFFNDRLKIAYSDQQLPNAFHRLFKEQDVRPVVRDMVVHSLKKGQIGVSLSYLPANPHGRQQTHATVSVMHDIRVFESLKEEDPTVYREIQSRAGVRDNVPYYLLDSITGASDENSV